MSLHLSCLRPRAYVPGHVQHNITTPFAHRSQVCDGRGPLFVSFSVFFFFLFLSFVADRFPSGSLLQDVTTPSRLLT